jgi:MFS transporter, MCT family, solute carrier family 16 (monocarboxylic acid transporters), member 14
MGYVGDRPEVNSLHFYVAMTTVAGVSTLIVPALSSFNLLAVYCAVFGFFISANYALTTIILVSLLGIERLTNAFGVVSMAGGIAILIGPPLAGKLGIV